MGKNAPTVAVSTLWTTEVSPFAGDLADRRDLARRLTDVVGRLPDGGVVAIDAPWGRGKTWFGRHWCAQLAAEKYQTVWLDSYECDYLDDPFLVIAAEFQQLVVGDTSPSHDFVQKTVVLTKTLLPVLAKGVVTGGVRLVLGERVEGAIEEAVAKIGDVASDTADEVVRQRLDELKIRRENVAAFRKSLAAFSKERELPIIFFVDELDRCRPTFAIQFLERLKHFFEVPGVVFVLLLNKAQLHCAISGIYGGIDPNAYLQKFLTLSIALPNGETEIERREFATRQLTVAGKTLGLDQSQWYEEFKEALAAWSAVFDLSFRDLERALGYYALCPRVPQPTVLLAYLICVRVLHPDLFCLIASDDPLRHAKAASWIDQLKLNNSSSELLRAMKVCHIYAATGDEPTDDWDKAALRTLFGRRMIRVEPEATFRHWCGVLDLRVE